jgi:hypothetical protein
MTPEEYEHARKKTRRYGESFDMHVDRYLPQDPVRTKKGAIAKRQPEQQKRTKAYYMGQCSFRGLLTKGTSEELQKRLKSRDRSQDVRIGKEVQEYRRQVVEETRRRDAESAEKWWVDPARTFMELLNKDPLRALKENLQKEDTLRRSFKMIVLCIHDLKKCAAELGLSYQSVRAPQGYRQDAGPGGPVHVQVIGQPVHVQIIGQEAAVSKQAKKIEAEVAKEARELEKKRVAAEKLAKAAQKARQQAVVAEAKEMDDWDLTGRWEVECEEMADYLSGPTRKLTMEIYRDYFDVANPRGEFRPNFKERGERGDDDDEDGVTDKEEDENDYDKYSDMDVDGDEYYGAGAGEEIRSAHNEHAATRPNLAPQAAQVPRFGATFSFGVITGTMRIYPISTTKKKNNNPKFDIKNNRTFEFIWRGRETGESEIQLGADKNTHRITFGNHGTSFKGTFKCPFIGGDLDIKGVKTSHGYGKKGSSAGRWSDLSEMAHDRESRSRWGEAEAGGK